MKHFYVICPVGADPSFMEKRAILKELAFAYKTEPFFPLDHRREFSIEDATKEMKLADFVLADLSLERPSCYFELGVAQAVGARVFLIAAAGTVIHQTGSQCNLVLYSNLSQYRLEVSRILAGPTPDTSDT